MTNTSSEVSLMRADSTLHGGGTNTVTVHDKRMYSMWSFICDHPFVYNHVCSNNFIRKDHCFYTREHTCVNTRGCARKAPEPNIESSFDSEQSKMGSGDDLRFFKKIKILDWNILTDRFQVLSGSDDL